MGKSNSTGMRFEYYRIDSVSTEGKFFMFDDPIPFQPVFRIGGTYNPLEYTFIRASYGQAMFSIHSRKIHFYICRWT